MDALTHLPCPSQGGVPGCLQSGPYTPPGGAGEPLGSHPLSGCLDGHWTLEAAGGHQGRAHGHLWQGWPEPWSGDKRRVQR